MTDKKQILLIVSGGIAAYKSLELVRILRRHKIAVRAVMTKSAAEFVTPLSLGVMTEDHVYGDMFDLKDEREIGHIQLSRQADLVVICPATANIMAKMNAGISDDLATTILLATDKPVLAVPAMNVRMWNHASTQRNIAQLKSDGVMVMTPDEGAMACGEFGPGRLPEPPEISRHICTLLGMEYQDHLAGGQSPTTQSSLQDFGAVNLEATSNRPLVGKHVLITAGPTHEAIDPVRYIANRSSGRQGFAIADAAAKLGASVTLIAGPVDQPTPAHVNRIDVISARDMQAAVHDALPVDCAIMVAAVADWRAADDSDQKIKKDGGEIAPLQLTENPDILAGLATHDHRPKLLIGFAAETEHVLDNARAKLKRKGCDWIIANDVSSQGGQSVMGGSHNSVHIITQSSEETLDHGTKEDIAKKIMEKIANAF